MVLLDTNILIKADGKTPPTVYTKLWKWFPCNQIGLKSVMAVHNEISIKNKGLRSWADDRIKEGFFIDHSISCIQKHKKAVTEHVMEEYPQTNSRRNFLSGADPWLIGAAMDYQCEIITLEKPASHNNKDRRVKIPDVASNFGVHCKTLDQFLWGSDITF